MPAQRVLVIGSLGWSLVNFRLDLMRRMVANGHSVIAAAPELDSALCERLAGEGIVPVEIPMQRTGLNPFHDLHTLTALRGLIDTYNPDLVVPYTMKPIVYGSLAARLAGVRCVPLFTGLGYAFSETRPRGKRLAVRTASVWLHRLATRRIRMAFYYNSAERNDIRRFRLVPRKAQLVAVPGSGVETARFSATPVPDGPPAFLFVGRLLRSKGLEELIAAARLLRNEGRAPRVELLGPTDSNPDAISADEVQRWHDAGEVIYHGPTRDVRPYLTGASVVVLPSKLREGVPRTMLEAMASGRAVITTDMPGCGETITDGQSGMVVPSGDPVALANAMRSFMDDPGRAVWMGEAARREVCETYDVHLVNRLLLTRMGLESPLVDPRSVLEDRARTVNA